MACPKAVVVQPVEVNWREVVESRVAEMKAKLDEFAKKDEERYEIAKNRVQYEGDPDQYYARLNSRAWSKVDEWEGGAQFLALAEILEEVVPVDGDGKIAEPKLFAILRERQPKYSALSASRQDVTYLFRYYRGYKDGFVKRGLLSVIKKGM